MIESRVVGRLRDRKSGSAGMPRPTSYAVFCLKKKRRAGHRRGLRAAPRPHRRGAERARADRARLARVSALRSLILAAADSPRLQRFVQRYGFKLGAARFVAGEILLTDAPAPRIYTLSLHDALPI